MPLIYCYINDFDAQTTCYIQTKENESPITLVIDVNSLAKSIPIYCTQYDIDKVHLFGTGSFLEGIADSIREEEAMIYNKNMIQIEVN